MKRESVKLKLINVIINAFRPNLSLNLKIKTILLHLKPICRLGLLILQEFSSVPALQKSQPIVKDNLASKVLEILSKF